MFGCAPGSIVDGPGIRYGVFVQGCPHRCPGCHNVKSQRPFAGKDKPIQEIYDDIMEHPSTSGVTFSGGEPFEQPAGLAELGRMLKDKNVNIWCYTGYLYEDLLKKPEAVELLDVIDVLVDGPFVLEKKSMDCLYRGSTNQRLIDMNKTRKTGKVETWTEEFKVPEKPASW